MGNHVALGRALGYGYQGSRANLGPTLPPGLVYSMLRLVGARSLLRTTSRDIDLGGAGGGEEGAVRPPPPGGLR